MVLLSALSISLDLNLTETSRPGSSTPPRASVSSSPHPPCLKEYGRHTTTRRSNAYFLVMRREPYADVFAAILSDTSAFFFTLGLERFTRNISVAPERRKSAGRIVAAHLSIIPHNKLTIVSSARRASHIPRMNHCASIQLVSTKLMTIWRLGASTMPYAAITARFPPKLFTFTFAAQKFFARLWFIVLPPQHDSLLKKA
jgi:hypothetical protein